MGKTTTRGTRRGSLRLSQASEGTGLLHQPGSLKGNPGGLLLKSDQGPHWLSARPPSQQLTYLGHRTLPILRGTLSTPVLKTETPRSTPSAEDTPLRDRPNGKTAPPHPEATRGGGGAAPRPRTPAARRGQGKGSGAQRKEAEGAFERDKDWKPPRPTRTGLGWGNTAKCGGKGRKGGPCLGFPPTH